MKKLLTKRNVLVVSGIFSLTLLTLNYIGTFKLCGSINNECMDILYGTLILFVPIIPIFLLSLITYKMREEIFHAWLTFAKWWILLTIVLVLLAPTTGYSLVPIDKGRVSLFMNALFLIFSLLIIAWKSYTLRGK